MSSGCVNRGDSSQVFDKCGVRKPGWSLILLSLSLSNCVVLASLSLSLSLAYPSFSHENCYDDTTPIPPRIAAAIVFSLLMMIAIIMTMITLLVLIFTMIVKYS